MRRGASRLSRNQTAVDKNDCGQRIRYSCRDKNKGEEPGRREGRRRGKRVRGQERIH